MSYNQYNTPKGEETLSIVALFFAIFVGGLPGLILGIMAKNREGPNGFNKAAIIIGACALILILIVVIFYIAVFASIMGGMGSYYY